MKNTTLRFINYSFVTTVFIVMFVFSSTISFAATYEPKTSERISKQPNGDEIDSDVIGSYYRATPDGRYVTIGTNARDALIGSGPQGGFVVYDTVEKKYLSLDILDADSTFPVSIFYDAYDSNKLKLLLSMSVDPGIIIDPNHPSINRGAFTYDIESNEYVLAAASSEDFASMFGSTDGRYFLLNTKGSYDINDTDGTSDIYRFDREDNSIQIMTDSPWGGLADDDTLFAGATNDMSKLIFVSENKFVENDNNNSADLYWYDFDSNRFVGMFQDIDGNFLPTGPFGGGSPDKIGEYNPEISPDGMHVTTVSMDVLSVTDTNSFPDEYLMSITSAVKPTYNVLTKNNDAYQVNASMAVYRWGVFSADSKKILVSSISGEMPDGASTPTILENNLYIYDIASGEHSKMMESNKTPGQTTVFLNAAFLGNNKIVFNVADPSVLGLNEDTDNGCTAGGRPLFFEVENTNCFDLYITEIEQVKGAGGEVPTEKPGENPPDDSNELMEPEPNAAGESNELPLTGGSFSYVNLAVLCLVGIGVVSATPKKDLL